MANLKILEAYSRLKSLRQNVPNRDVELKYIDEFHQILEILEAEAGADLKSFRVPASEVRPVIVRSNYLTQEKHYSDRPFCDYAYFVMKADAVLTMFDVLLSESSTGKPVIGFKPPDR